MQNYPADTMVDKPIRQDGHSETDQTMTHEEQIKDLAKAVHGALTLYVAVHNKIFREASTFRSALKNLVGLGVPMSVLLAEAKALVPFWEAIGSKIEEFRGTEYNGLSSDEKRYFDILTRYVATLRRTVDLLVMRQQFMADRSEGVRSEGMSWKAHKQREEAYNSSIEEYSAIGVELNAASRFIFR
ncbi:MAG: hypothetical protein PHE83_06915 [Opitutaceae bacterium]|nr:hypothetical protein [Opitutaceae bacterium]